MERRIDAQRGSLSKQPICQRLTPEDSRVKSGGNDLDIGDSHPRIF